MAQDGGGHAGRSVPDAWSLPAAYLDLAAELARSEDRHLLDLATGVLVAQQSMEPAVAAESLRRLAARAGVPVRDLAADLVSGACGVPIEASEASDGSLAASRARLEAVTAAEVSRDLGDVTRTLLRALQPLGVQGLLVWRRTASDCLRLAASAGFTPLDRARWSQIPPQWQALPQRALAEAEPIWLPHGVGDAGELPGPALEAARAVLPLRHEGISCGVVLVAWREPRAMNRELRLQVSGVLDVLARVLGSVRHLTDPGGTLPVLASTLDLLAEPAITLRKAREEAADGSPVLFVEHMNAAAQRRGSGVPRPVGRPLAHVLPQVADDLTALVAEAYRHQAVQRAPRLPVAKQPGTVPLLNVRVLPVSAERCAVLWHAEGRDHSFSVLNRAGRLGSLAAFEDDRARGVTQWSEQVAPLLGLPADAEPFPLERLADLVVPEDKSDLIRMLDALTSRLEGVSGMLRFPRPDGGVRHVRLIADPLLTHGTLTGLTGFFQDASAQYQTEVALAATFDRLGSVQAQADLRHRLALQLQQAIVPEQPGLDALPGLRVAARYRPAAEEYRVGGDWYDVLALPDGRVLIAVGDVAGHGIDAATGMVALKNALRGLSCSGSEPGDVMRSLNEAALRTTGRPTATTVCAFFDPVEQTLQWTSAGHLPPLLLRDGRARLLESAPNLLLGAVPGTRYQESLVNLRGGDLLLLCTDGLIERRRSSLDDALAMLARALEGLNRADDLETGADMLLAAARGDTDDDASLVLIRVQSGPQSST
ncbi:SpoIIE family protein phosphatase [Streptacidiphilus jiangxiensis]|uniref:Serine phosphatase RsbU, regulator of sigma subunit n=1 Tax=Streptacidiphilus jiangxiensis TaxID=235985 RepID=A0A1H7NVI0_STRJI|nr:SpoIIE family protein phosphatase [Streptacidiphilus jiangxiensis]SEL27522.1 Serine phosphatase RsbU, regulator of sigma subunit [Streptacidiphilus jiangxiensis]